MGADAKFLHAKAAWLREREKEFDEVIDVAESPIERLVAAELLVCDWTPAGSGWWQEIYRALSREPSVRCPPAPPLILDRDCHFVVPQLPVIAGGATYRLDFAAFAVRVTPDGVSIDTKVAVELDGHAFHERTKEQAAHDKARDRALTLAGWKVLRFTGSEVYASASAVCEQLVAALIEPVRAAS